MDKLEARKEFETKAMAAKNLLDRLFELVPAIQIDGMDQSIISRYIAVAIGQVWAAIDRVAEATDDSPPSNGIGF